MKKLLLLKLTLLLLLLSNNLQAQFQNELWTGKQAYNWYFYDKAGLNFETSPPTALLDGQIDELPGEGTGSISDTDGNLLFYTNGKTVWNRNHVIMQNGDGLMGDVSATQTGLIVPVPGTENKFYVFSVIGQGPGVTSVYYSEVDMLLDNGLGAVTNNKNILLSTPQGEKITAIHHSDQEQVWLVCHSGCKDAPSNTFRSFLISQTGINMVPVESSIGEVVGFSYGQMKISPDGRKIAFINGRARGGSQLLQVFDFDNTNGRITNSVNLTSAIAPAILPVTGPSSYGLEFSPNSKFLYAADPSLFELGKLHQFDLEAGSEAQILDSDVVLVEDLNRFFSLQLGPDGKIYSVEPGAIFLNVINYPNNKGLAAGYEGFTVDLAGRSPQLGLPGFIQSYFESGILHEGICAKEAVTFSTIRIPGIESVVWNFGDMASGAANTSTEITPSHNYARPGTYTVTATITSNGAQQTATTEVTITAPDAVVPAIPAVCADSNGNAVFNLTQLNAGILNGQDATQFTLNYFATEADLEADTPIITPESFTTSGQNIFALVTNTQTGCKTSIQFNLPVNPMPQATAPLLLEKCATPAGTAAFNLKQQDAAILNGQDAANFTVTYFSDADAQNLITAPDNFTSSGQTVYAIVSNNATDCTSAIVSFPVTVTQASLFANALQLTGCSPFNLGLVDTQLEEGLDLSFYTSRADAENDANNIPDPQQFIIAGNEGIVYVRAKNSDGCVNVAELVLHQGDCSIPKGISPNGDDKNDTFDLSGFNVAYLGIYNRFGQEVYSRSNYTSEWHGQSSNNNELPTGTYYYMVKRGDGRSETGWVYVNREE
jgi:gliding motility-associated-like protein